MVWDKVGVGNGTAGEGRGGASVGKGKVGVGSGVLVVVGLASSRVGVGCELVAVGVGVFKLMATAWGNSPPQLMTKRGPTGIAILLGFELTWLMISRP